MDKGEERCPGPTQGDICRHYLHRFEVACDIAFLLHNMVCAAGPGQVLGQIAKNSAVICNKPNDVHHVYKHNTVM